MNSTYCMYQSYKPLIQFMGGLRRTERSKCMEICGIRAVCSKPTPKCMKLSSLLTLGTEKLFKILLLHTWVGGDAQDLLDSPNYGLLFSFHGGMDPQRVTGATSLLRQGHPRAQDSVRCFWNIPREETPQPLCSLLRAGPCSAPPSKTFPNSSTDFLALDLFYNQELILLKKRKTPFKLMAEANS